MPTAYPVQTNFTGGEIAPGLQGRMDQSKFANSCQTLENFITLPQGGVIRRPGIRQVFTAKQADYHIKLVEFVFSTNIEESYIIEFGCWDSDDGVKPYIRIYHPPTLATAHVVEILHDGTRYTWDGNTYVITSTTDPLPWTGKSIAEGDEEDDPDYDIPNLWCKQYGDLLYIADGRHPVMKLSRDASSDAGIPAGSQPGTWNIETAGFTGKPYRPLQRRAAQFYYALDPEAFITTTGGNRFINYNIYDSKYFSKFFEPDNAYILKHYSYFEIEDPVFGIVIGEPASDADHYNNASYTVEKLDAEVLNGFRSPDYYGNSTKIYLMKIDTTIWIPEEDKYYFGINCADWGDLYVGETGESMDSVVSFLGEPHTAMDFNEKEFIHHGSVTLRRGARNMMARLGVHPAKPSVDSYWGLVVAWRRNGDLVTWNNGSWITPIIPNEMITVTHFWFGNQIYEVEIVANANETTFSWRWRRQTSIDPETYGGWRDAAGQKWVYDDEGEVITEYWSTGNFSISPQNFIITDPDGDPFKEGDTGPFGTWKLASINFVTTSYAEGTKWRFKCGFQPIPASQFRMTITEAAADEYPSVIEIVDQRMFLGGFTTPVIRLSKIGDFENFSRGPNDDDGIELLIASGKFDKVVACAMLRDLIAMTTSTIYRIGSDGPTITPSDRYIKPVSDIGASACMPVKVGSTIVFADRSKKRMIGMTWNEWDVLIFPDISIWSYHLFSNHIKELKFQPVGILDWSKDPIPLIWIVTDAGELRALTLEEQHKVYAFSKHSSAGAVFESIAVIPGVGKDVLWLAYKRDTTRYIGYLDETLQCDDYVQLTKNPVYTSADNQWIWYSIMGMGTLFVHCKRFAGKYIAVYETEGENILLGYITLDDNGLGTLIIEEPIAVAVGFVYESRLTPVTVSVEIGGMPTAVMQKRRARVWLQTLYTSGLTVDGEPFPEVASQTDPEWHDVILWGWSRNPIFDIVQAAASPAKILSLGDKVKINAP